MDVECGEGHGVSGEIPLWRDGTFVTERSDGTIVCVCAGIRKSSAFAVTDLFGNTLQVTIRTKTKKNDPTYYLTVVTQGKTGEPQTIEVSRSFADWFDETGRFVAKPFQAFLASSVPAVGKQDPQRIKSVAEDLVQGNPELLDAMLAEAAPPEEAASTAAETTGKKGKRRKN